VGGALHHTGLFDPITTTAALTDATTSTMHFGVPTIYSRLADAADHNPSLVAALAQARLLVSGSAGLPRSVHEHIEALTGQVIVERYGMTETMITTAVPAGTRDAAGTVGRALPGVEMRLVDEAGTDVPDDGETMGELLVRAPSMFSGYVGRPDATAAAFRDGWFATGDVATRDERGYVRIVGRRSTDIIKCGGFKIGAGEIEDALLEHPRVGEAAVRGVPDDDLGERIVAWVAPSDGTALDPAELDRHLADRLVTHKRPRAIHIVDALPRNGMGKVEKARLTEPSVG
jgi:malonyl-CoA/methylmalonyl-CoA synthetase